MKNPTTTERTSDRELVVTRTFDAPARMVFAAWTKPELFQRWWVPKGAPIVLVSCDLDVRPGGRYRLEFTLVGDDSQRMEFFGRYLEVVPPTRLVWTNEEGDGDGAVTTVTFTEQAGRTKVVVHDLYPSKAALDEAIASGSTSGMPAQLEQLAEFLASSAR